MADEKKSLFDKAVDALTNRDEKAALEKAKKDAEAAKVAAAKAAADKAAAAKKEADRIAAQHAAVSAAAKKKLAEAEKAAAAKAEAQRIADEKAKAEALAASKVGIVKESLKLRSGPGEEYDPPIGWLKPDTRLEILEELDYWLKVKVEGKEGYVGKKYVKFTSLKGS